MKRTDYEKRIARADDLIARESASREILTFYRHILELQQRMDRAMNSSLAAESNPKLRERIDVELAAKWLPEVFALIKNEAPVKLAVEVGRIQALDGKSHRQLVRDYISGREVDDAASTLVARVTVQPIAEAVARQATFTTSGSEATCPLCGGKPQLAVLRPEGDGGKRFLLCSFCSTEWEFRRVLCPMCGETDHTKLPRYLAEEPMAVRVEGCDACRRYLKSFDATLDGLLVPEVDEIASPALDIWACEHGYRKIQANVMGF
jgi:formate dehydrogenase accessory protein FdhE